MAPRIRHQLKKRIFLIFIFFNFSSVFTLAIFVLSQQHTLVMQMLDIRHLTKTCSKQIIPSLCGGLISPSELLASPLNEKKKKEQCHTSAY